jgi:aspartyl-tRNA(Asn)/glutamyl-tRNA(Gln) amidotransferase subunit A
VTKLLESEGAIIVGKTNLDEFAMGSSTENSAYGPTLNPVDLTRVPGGSSGGSASSVAAGIVPIALGSDTGGSIRQPASLCGVVGVKPTYGRVSRYGLVAFASSLDQIGPFSSTVMDSALTLEVIAGFDPKDSTSYDEQMGSLSSQKGLSVEGLRVGIVTEFVEGSDPEVVSALRDAADALASLGADVVEISIPETKLGLSAYYLIAPAEASSNLARFDGVRFGLRVEGSNIEETNVLTRTKGFGAEVKRRIMLGTYALSSGYYDAYYAKAQQVRTLIKTGFERAYQQVDVLISPVSPTTAFKLGEKSLDPLTMYLSDVCTIPSNLAGHPAMSMPYALDSQGLPIGVQILAPALREDLMFRLAFALEGSSRGAPSLDASIKEAINHG